VLAIGDIGVVLDHPDIEIVVNLAIPAAHIEASKGLIAAPRQASARSGVVTSGNRCSR